MGRFVSADDPGEPGRDRDEAAALKDESGKPGRQRRPQHMGDRDRPLDRAQHVLYGRADLAVGIVVGIALVLTGMGLVILALDVFGRRRGQPAAS